MKRERERERKGKGRRRDYRSGKKCVVRSVKINSSRRETARFEMAPNGFIERVSSFFVSSAISLEEKKRERKKKMRFREKKKKRRRRKIKRKRERERKRKNPDEPVAKKKGK